MNFLIAQKIADFEKCCNNSEKVVCINHAIEFIVMYYATIFYCHTKHNKIVNRELVELIQTNFYKRNPLTSSWLKLLQSSISLLNLKIFFQNKELNEDFQKAAKYFLPDSSSREIKSNPSLKDICESYSIIRSKGFAHSNSLSKDCVSFLISHSFDKIPYYLNDCLSSQDISKLYLSETICASIDDGQEYFSTFFDLSNQIKKSVKLLKNNQIDFENLYSKNLYLHFPQTQSFIPVAPFFIHRDENFYFYSGIDNHSQPVYSEIIQNKNISVKKYEHAFKDIIKDDVDLINSQEIIVKLKYENGIYHNLPTPSYNKFVGRIDTIDKIVKALNNRRIFLIGISGIGGVGKSAIAIKIARDFIDYGKKEFTFIIWVSAKRTYLTAEGIHESEQIFSNLTQLLDVILKITGFVSECHLTYSIKKEIVIEILSLDKFLLIIDNFETVNNPPEFLSFFEEIGDKAPETKIILTTRHQLGSSEKVIDLREFSQREYSEFIEYLVNIKYPISKKLTPKHISALYDIAGGLALATELITGQLLSSNISIDRVIAKFKSTAASKDNILEFSFKESYNLLNETQRKVLYAVSMLDNPAFNSISFLTGLDEFDIDESIAKLLQLSFINRNSEHKITLLPLTKIFLLSKLEKDNILREQLYAKHKEYLFITTVSEYLEKYETGLETTISKDDIALRLSKAAYFMAKQGNYSKSEEYFNQAIQYDSQNSQVWLYWATASRDFSNTIKDDYYKNAIKFASETEREAIEIEYARAIAAVGRDKECISILESVVNNNPNNKNAYHILGKAYYDIGRNLWKKREFQAMKKNYTNSTDAFLKSIYRNPESLFEKNSNTIAFYFLAKISRWKNETKRALEYVQRGLELQPSNFKLIDFKEDLERNL